MGKHNLHSFDLKNQQIEIRILNANANIKVSEIGMNKSIFMVSFDESLVVLKVEIGNMSSSQVFFGPFQKHFY